MLVAVVVGGGGGEFVEGVVIGGEMNGCQEVCQEVCHDIIKRRKKRGANDDCLADAPKNK